MSGLSLTFEKSATEMELLEHKQQGLVLGAMRIVKLLLFAQSLSNSLHLPPQVQGKPRPKLCEKISGHRVIVVPWSVGGADLRFGGDMSGLSITFEKSATEMELLEHDQQQGNPFQNAVFNETIQVVEPDEGLDGETFFLYVFLAAIGILLLVGAQQLVSSLGKKHRSKSRPFVEMGTQNADIDYDWIPKETIKEMNRSPRRTPKQSPRQRRSKRSSGSGEE